MTLRYKIAIIIFLTLATIGGIRDCKRAYGEEIGIASWYSTKESKGVMANGHKMEDNRLSCASWNYEFGDLLVVRNMHNNRSVIVEVTDRGPGQPKCSCLKKPQRIVDLSKASFEKLAPLSEGVISVRIEQIK